MLAIEVADGAKPLFLPNFSSYTISPDNDVNAMCRELGVVPISEFLDRIRFDVPEGEDDSTWYSSSDGAATFASIAKGVADNPGHLGEQSRTLLIAELEEASELLAEAARNGKDFHIVVVIVPRGTDSGDEQ